MRTASHAGRVETRWIESRRIKGRLGRSVAQCVFQLVTINDGGERQNGEYSLVHYYVVKLDQALRHGSGMPPRRYKHRDARTVKYSNETRSRFYPFHFGCWFEYVYFSVYMCVRVLARRR